MRIHDLDTLLASSRASRGDGVFTVVALDAAPLNIEADAPIREHEGTSYVISWTDAVDSGLDPRFRAACLTLEIESGRESIWLTAAAAGALFGSGIACNVLAAFHHDQLLVPDQEATRAVAVLAELAANHQVT